MKVTIDTNNYYFANNKQPRGTGVWFFESDNGKQASYYGSYTECKKQAIEWAKENGYRSIKVCS